MSKLLLGVGVIFAVFIGLPFYKKYVYEKAHPGLTIGPGGKATFKEEFLDAKAGIIDPDEGGIMTNREVQEYLKPWDTKEEETLIDQITKDDIYVDAYKAQKAREDRATEYDRTVTAAQRDIAKVSDKDLDLMWGAIDMKEQEAQESSKVVVERYRERVER